MKLSATILMIVFQMVLGVSLFAGQQPQQQMQFGQYQQQTDTAQVSSAQPCQTVTDQISKVQTRTCTMQADGCLVEFLTRTSQSFTNQHIVIQLTQTADKCISGGEAQVGILYQDSDQPQTFLTEQVFNCQGRLVIPVKDFVSDNQKVLTAQPVRLIQVNQRGRVWEIKLNQSEQAQFLQYLQ